MVDVSEFNLSEKIAALNSNEAAEFIDRLKSFTDDFPEAEKTIKNAFEKKDYASFKKYLESVRNTLTQISAGCTPLGVSFVPECDKLISASVEMNEDAEAQLTQLLSILTMLSIDIQMALYREDVPQIGQSAEPTHDNQSAQAVSESEKIILAVDDNPYFLTALKKALSETNYKLICVSLGLAALNFLDKQKQTASALPGLFVLDIEMPEMNGYELAGKIREKGSKAPIIFMTGNSAKEYVLKAIKAGAADFIVKPISQENVLARIRKYI